METKQSTNAEWLTQNLTESEAVREYYDDWAGEYDETLKKWRYDSPQVVASLLAEKLPPDARILDAGCGTGLSGKALAEAGFTKVSGFDISARSIACAEALKCYTELDCLNLQDCPYPYGADVFDGLSCVGVLTYLPNLGPVFNEFCRLVRPGGWVVFTSRDDLYRERNISDAIQSMASAGRWRVDHMSRPMPYLPENEDFSDKIKVLYFRFEVL